MPDGINFSAQYRLLHLKATARSAKTNPKDIDEIIKDASYHVQISPIYRRPNRGLPNIEFLNSIRPTRCEDNEKRSLIG